MKMINKRELQIGNWVNRSFWNPHPRTPSLCFDWSEVVAIGQEKINVKMKGGLIERRDYADVFPILLTDFLLEKCGFTENGRHEWCNGLWLWNRGIMCLKNKATEEFNCITAVVDHVHQLQNLLSAFEGHEFLLKLQ